MKRVIILGLGVIFWFTAAGQCPGLPTGTPGFRPDSNTLACVVQGMAYNETVAFELPDSVDVGSLVPLDSVRIDSIINLPCGIGYSLDRPTALYAGGETGCITLSGTTTDGVGQYTQEILVTVWINSLGTFQSVLSQTGLNHYLRVKATAGANCPVVDANDPGLTASGTTCTGPALAVSADANPDTICAGNSTDLSALATGGTGTYSYTWSPGGLTGATVSVSPTITTTYVVAATDTQGATVYDSVTVEVLPVVNPAVTIVANPAAACAGTAITFTASPTNGGNNPIFQWTVNSNNPVNGDTFTTNGLNAGDAVVLSMTTSATCATASTVSDQLLIQSCTVTCPGPPTGTPGFRPDSNSLPCVIQNLVYNEQEEFEIPLTTTITTFPVTIDSVRIDSITNLPCGISYTLDEPDATYNGGTTGCITLSGTTSDVTGQYLQQVYVTAYAQGFPPINTTLGAIGINHYLRVKATIGSACPVINPSGPNQTASGINCGGPPLSVSAAANPDTVCAGVSTSLTAAASGGVPGYNYTWNPGGLSGASVGVTPATTTSYTVTAYDQAGDSAIAIITVEVIPAVTPTVSIGAAPTGLCDNVATTFTANVTNGGTAPIYAWALNSSPVSTSSTYSSAGLADGDVLGVTVTSNASCASPGVVTDMVTIISCAAACPGPPTGTAGFRPDSNNVDCIVQGVAYTDNIEFELPGTLAGQSFTSLTIDSITNMPCGITYTLDRMSGVYGPGEVGCATFSGTSTDVVGQYKLNVYVTVVIPGFPTLQGELGSLAGTLGIVGFNQYLRVKATAGAACPNINGSGPNLISSGVTCPPPALVVTAGANPTTVCAGDSVVLSASATGGSGNYTYTWAPGAIGGATVTVFPASTTTYTVTANDGSVTGTATATVTVIQNIVPSVSISTAPSTLCDNTALTFSASPAGGGLLPTYTWRINGVAVGSTSNYSNAGLTAGDVVSVTMYSSSVCALPDTAYAEVTIISCPGPSVSAQAFPDTICPGDSSELVASATGGLSGFTFIWSPTTGLSSTTGAAVMASPGATTTYTVVADNGSVTVSDDVVVTVYTAPIADAGNDTTVCTGSSATLTATGGTSFNWSPAATLSCAGCGSPVATPTANTTYSVTVTDGNGCTATDDVTVSLTASVQASVVIEANKDTLCAGDVLTFTATPTNGGTTPAYDWTINGIGAPSNTNVLYISGLNVGDEIVCVMTSSELCSSPAQSNVLVVDSCGTIIGLQDKGVVVGMLQVFPSPTTGPVMVQMPGARGKTQIQVFNMQGKLLVDKEVQANGSLEVTLDLGDAADGIYLLQVKNQRGVTTRKVIKH